MHHSPRTGTWASYLREGWRRPPSGQISQLKVGQLLGTSPQVIYPVGLNGHDEPIVTTLQDPLASSVSLTTSKYIYLGIDIPSPPVEEPDQKIPPLCKVSTILIASPHKSPLKLEGSMTMEVSNLLSRAVLEASSFESEHLSPRRPTPAVVLMTPPWKPEGPLWPVDTSSQASVKETEASLEDIPTSISPIAAISLEGQVIQEKTRSQADVLSACQVILYNSPPELKSTLATSYHILLGQPPPLPPLAPPWRTSPMEEQPTMTAPTTLVPKESHRPKRWHLHQILWRACLWAEPLRRLLWDNPPAPRGETPPWFKTLKPSHANAFSQDSDMVREARREFFSKHLYNFTTDSTHDLSRTFRQLTVSANLLGTSIHEIQASWTGPKELKQANYAL